jgi:hypothetical protein
LRGVTVKEFTNYYRPVPNELSQFFSPPRDKTTFASSLDKSGTLETPKKTKMPEKPYEDRNK